MSDTPRHDRLVGTILDGRFELDRVLGAGGMGKVYAGRQLSVDRSVAVKVLREELSESESLTARFFREAKVVASLRHSNIVGLVDFGKDDERGLLYIAMEYVDGLPLSKLMRQGRFEPALAVAVLRQMCSALAEAHSAGVVHRDLKPDNVMLQTTAEGTLVVKVLDFGIALPTGEEARLTNTGAVVGTPFYMAPEQAQDQPVTPASDIYSLGVLLFEMLSGELPFTADTPMAVLLKAIQQPPPALSSILGPEDMPPAGLSALLGDLLQKRPDDRPPSVAVMGRRLDDIAKQAQLTVPRAADTSELAALVIDRDATARALAETAASPVPTASASPTVGDPAPIITPVPHGALTGTTSERAVEPPEIPPRKTNRLPPWWPALLAIPLGCLCLCMSAGDGEKKLQVTDVVTTGTTGLPDAGDFPDGDGLDMPAFDPLRPLPPIPPIVPEELEGVEPVESPHEGNLRNLREAVDKAERALDDDPQNDPHEIRNIIPPPDPGGAPAHPVPMAKRQLSAGTICQLPECHFTGDTVPGAAVCQDDSTCTAECTVSGCRQVCSGDATCDYKCSSGSCVQVCAGDATCNFHCGGGACMQDCAGSANCVMRCPGGNCSQKCKTSGECKKKCRKGSCG